MELKTITLFDRNEELVEEFKRARDTLVPHFYGQGVIEIKAEQISIESDVDLDADALVTAGNSFGIMDGGIDAAVRDKLPGVQNAVYSKIYHDHNSQMIPGNAIIVDVPANDPRYLVYAPTMRSPRVIVDPEVVYDAVRVSVFKVLRHNQELKRNRYEDGAPIRSMLIPGMGTATGRVPYRQAAELTILGIHDALEPMSRPTSWETPAPTLFYLDRVLERYIPS